MSLLEDVFLQDEANEAEQLERVIEGDEYEERPRSDSDENSEKEDEAEEEKRRVDPTAAKAKRVIKNPRFLLNPARLTGPRGIQVIPDHFKDFKFKGKGHEKEDLDLVLKKLEHWAYRLYPKYQFEDCLKKIEMLGKKRPVMVHLHKIRSDQFMSEDTVVQKDSSDEDTPMPEPEEDEFDKLLQQQIELARSTPAPGSTKKAAFDDLLNDRNMHPGLDTPKDHRATSLMMPKATSSPSISDEQKERMLRNRKLAEERRLARLKNANKNNEIPENNTVTDVPKTVSPVQSSTDNVEQTNQIVEHTKEIEEQTDTFTKVLIDPDDVGVVLKQNRSNVIDSSSSDEEIEAETNMSIVVDVHNTVHIDDTQSSNLKSKNKSFDEENRNTEVCDESHTNIVVREDYIQLEEETGIKSDFNSINCVNSNEIKVTSQSNDNIHVEVKENDVLVEVQIMDSDTNPLNCHKSNELDIACRPTAIEDNRESDFEESSSKNNLIYNVDSVQEVNDTPIDLPKEDSSMSVVIDNHSKEIENVNDTNIVLNCNDSVKEINVTENDLGDSENVNPNNRIAIDNGSETVNNTYKDNNTDLNNDTYDPNLDKETIVDAEELSETMENGPNNTAVNVPVEDIDEVMDVDFADDF